MSHCHAFRYYYIYYLHYDYDSICLKLLKQSSSLIYRFNLTDHWLIMRFILFLDCRMEDVTDPENIRQNPKCDRNVCLYGYVRGTHFKPHSNIHIPGNALLSLWQLKRCKKITSTCTYIIQIFSWHCLSMCVLFCSMKRPERSRTFHIGHFPKIQYVTSYCDVTRSYHDITSSYHIVISQHILRL